MNGHITRLVAVFAISSLGATLLPLLDGGGGAPLIGVADRSSSLVVYAIFLALFGAFLFPALAARDASPRTWPWVVLAVLILGFAAIPLVVTAYMSGVSKEGLAVVGCMLASCFGASLACRRWLGAGPGVLGAAALGAVGLLLRPWGRRRR